MKLRILLPVFLCIQLLFCTTSATAQYWGVWQKTHNITLGVSSDDKWVFFVQKNDGGIDNIYKIELKTNTITPVTTFIDRPVLSGIVLFGKSPAIVFTRAVSAGGNDIHLYRINVLTTDPALDITPGTGSTNKKILGMADNGRYVYYLSDHGPGSHTDTYRYDTQQYITELAFANDKDFETLCWSHDQTRLLLYDPRKGDYYDYSIETTDKQKSDSITLLKDYRGIIRADLSVNQKYLHYPSNPERVIETLSNSILPLPTGAFDIVVSPKETSVLYVNKDASLAKLYLYDIPKKTLKELTTIK